MIAPFEQSDPEWTWGRGGANTGHTTTRSPTRGFQNSSRPLYDHASPVAARSPRTRALSPLLPRTARAQSPTSWAQDIRRMHAAPTFPDCAAGTSFTQKLTPLPTRLSTSITVRTSTRHPSRPKRWQAPDDEETLRRLNDGYFSPRNQDMLVTYSPRGQAQRLSCYSPLLVAHSPSGSSGISQTRGTWWIHRR
jgi:hypothetical protein